MALKPGHLKLGLNSIEAVELHRVLRNLWTTFLLNVEVLRSSDVGRQLLEAVKQRKVSYLGNMLSLIPLEEKWTFFRRRAALYMTPKEEEAIAIKKRNIACHFVHCVQSYNISN